MLFFHGKATMRTIKQVSKERCPRFPFAIKWTLDHEIEKRKKNDECVGTKGMISFLGNCVLFLHLIPFQKKSGNYRSWDFESNCWHSVARKGVFCEDGQFCEEKLPHFFYQRLFSYLSFHKKVHAWIWKQLVTWIKVAHMWVSFNHEKICHKCQPVDSIQTARQLKNARLNLVNYKKTAHIETCSLLAKWFG